MVHLVHYRYKSPLVLFGLSLPAVVALLSCHDVTALSVSNNIVPKVPNRWRLNSKGQPRLCGVVGATLQVLVRTGLFFPSSIKQIQIDVSAKSNRAVLQGKLDQVSIQIQKSKSSVLQLEELMVHGSNMDLGYKPLFLMVILPLLLILTRPSLLAIFSCWYMWKMIQKQIILARQKQNNNPSKRPSLWLGKIQKKLSGGDQPPSCHLDYSITITNDDLSNSTLLRKASKHLLRSLLSNSALPTVAAVGDTAQMLQDAQAKVDPSTGQLVLPKQQQQQQQQQQDANAHDEKSTYKLTKLLSATSFDLRESPRFESNGWLVLPSQAVLPQEEGKLDFVLRTKPACGSAADAAEGSLLEFLSPQVRFEVDAIPLPPLVGKLLPKVVWLPVGGAGVALHLPSFGYGNRLQRLGIANEGTCRLDGSIDLFATGRRQGPTTTPPQQYKDGAIVPTSQQHKKPN